MQLRNTASATKFFAVNQSRKCISVYSRGSQPFSCHVPLQHSDRSACTPSAFQQMHMYP